MKLYPLFDYSVLEIKQRSDAMEKYRITLSKEERRELESLVGKGKAAARKLAHARILLLADDSQSNVLDDDAIASTLSLGLRTVSRVRKRFVPKVSLRPWTTSPNRRVPTRSRSKVTSSRN